MTDERDIAALTSDICGARDRLIARVETLSDDIWAAPLSSDDPRPVGIVCDHVAHSYEYLGAWVRELLAGMKPEVSPDLVDQLNGQHADSPLLTRADVVDHLLRSGDTFLQLVSSMGEQDLPLGDGLARQFLVIAARHPDGHRAEIDALIRP